MNEAAQTIEGWYALHEFRSVDWSAWLNASVAERQEVLSEWWHTYESWQQVEQNKQGSTVLFQILGHKADVAFIHLRESLQQLAQLETAFSKTKLAQYTYPTYSYVSVVELSNYVIKQGEDPLSNPDIAARLKPIMPRTQHVCFYPMNKKRDGADNWYMLTMDERKAMMRQHGLIGRSYAGKVKQIISGSIGFDNWEWGVTLFADDALHFKKLIYEMRFDEASARFAQFGDFYVGNLLDKNQITSLFTE